MIEAERCHFRGLLLLGRHDHRHSVMRHVLGPDDVAVVTDAIASLKRVPGCCRRLSRIGSAGTVHDGKVERFRSRGPNLML